MTRVLTAITALGLALFACHIWRAFLTADQTVRDALADLEHKD
ncbi:hypothetical protein [Actinokineospora sp.]